MTLLSKFKKQLGDVFKFFVPKYSENLNFTKLYLVKIGILLPKLFWPIVRKKISNDQENVLKFEAEGREFAKILRSLLWSP